MALLRPTFEAFVRGYWLSRGATDAQAADFLNMRFDPSLDSMVRRLQKVDPAGSLLGKLKRGWTQLMDDYTHGGTRQLSRYLGSDDIGPQHSDMEMVEALSCVNAIGLFACTVREELSGRAGGQFIQRLEEELTHRAQFES